MYVFYRIRCREENYFCDGSFKVVKNMFFNATKGIQQCVHDENLLIVVLTEW